eukprot:TRINITY_DN1219_c0_g1_i1.p1 TRINITY_DN1219_c0_g1~~TRINITY_DN1219_c0_g1_i1.p1  ORF type:complete len:371 (-),score=65.83 TRINITY_DN1219_c0_g1_i1:86-1198(-)
MNLTIQFCSFFSFVCLVFILRCTFVYAQPFPKLNIAPNSLTISGISSGAAFSVQYHVAHSSIVQGTAIFAGIPYYCAADDLETALTACTVDPSNISVDELILATSTAYSLDSIDDPTNLAQSRLWLWSGLNDTIIKQGVMDKVYSYYANYINPAKIVYWKNVSSEHAWISNTFGNACPYLGSPFINNCHVDAPGQLLHHLYPSDTLKFRPKNPSSFLTFSQHNYLPLDVLDPAEISMAKTGYMYVPQACRNGQQCKLHFCFHGCEQNYASVNFSFVNNTGLNEWAEGSGIIVVYPQTINSEYDPFNPEGCWDWWGYTGPDYATQEGPQIESVYNMMITLMSGQPVERKEGNKKSGASKMKEVLSFQKKKR